MYKILKACNLASNIFLMDVEAKRVAAACEPGQFVIVRIDERGERIPLTICDYDRKRNGHDSCSDYRSIYDEDAGT